MFWRQVQPVENGEVIESVYPAGLSVHEHVHGRYSTAVPAPLPWPELARTPPAHGRSATSARTA
jgi:hypothetical protein